MAANSVLTRMLSSRTLRDASASRAAPSCARVSRFIRSTARRMYAALDRRSERTHFALPSASSSGSLSEIARVFTPRMVSIDMSK